MLTRYEVKVDGEWIGLFVGILRAWKYIQDEDLRDEFNNYWNRNLADPYQGWEYIDWGKERKEKLYKSAFYFTPKGMIFFEQKLNFFIQTFLEKGLEDFRVQHIKNDNKEVVYGDELQVAVLH